MSKSSSNYWIPDEVLKTKLNNKKIIFWGASHWIYRFNETYKNKAEFIIDNSKLNEGIKYNNLIVYSPKYLKKFKKKDLFIIITTGNYPSVISELESLGYQAGINFCCCPLLKIRKDIEDQKQINRNLLISSHMHFFGKNKGGGLYLYNLISNKFTKIYQGKCRGISNSKTLYFIVDMLKGVLVLNKKFEIVDVFKLPKNSEAHGIAYFKNKIYVVCAGRDSILILNSKSGNFINEIFISEKWKINQQDNHHINDIHVNNDGIFVSMFSFRGEWLQDKYDGGVLHISHNLKFKNKIIDKLFMPHSIKISSGNNYVCNSMRGELLINGKTFFKCSGFTRGIDFENDNIYVGVNEHRYPEKIYSKDRMFGISINTGLFIINSKNKISRFISFENKFNAYHDFILI